MSILNSIKRFVRRLLFKEVEKEVEKEVQKEVDKKVSEKYKEAVIPSEYSDFPVFVGNCVSMTNKKTDKYIRFTMDFNKVTPEMLKDYEAKMAYEGFTKETDVRYEYKNKYIIYEPDGSYLHLVFHIKK
ncbi:MAG: hypothetical protein J5666_03765 [Bacilli bacterium]|nr:hypothetical protein [Bacilli bacterium]